MRRCAAVILLLVVGSPSGLFAQGSTTVPSRPHEVTIGPPTPRTPLDGKVTGLNLPVFEKVRAIQAAGGPGMTEAGAEALIQAIRADGSVDPAEWDLLDELCNSRTRAIKITPAAADGAASNESVSLTSVAGNTLVRVIAAIPVLDLEKAWSDGAAGWAAITAEHGRGGVTALRTVHFVADKLAAEWRKSTTANAYKPLVDAVSARYKLCDAVGEAKTASRTLLREGMVLVDLYDGGKVPDFLYTWIN